MDKQTSIRVIRNQPAPCQIGHVPPHVTIDTADRTARWFGVFEVETIDLDAPAPG